MNRFIALVAVVGIALLTTSQASLATSFTLSVNGFSVTDQGPGDLNPAVNQITYISGSGGTPSIPGITANVETALTNLPGSSTGSFLDVNWAVEGTGTVQIIATADGFTTPSGLSTLNSAVGGTATNASVSTQQCIEPAGNCISQGPFTTSSFSNTTSQAFSVATPFALDEIVNVAVTSGLTTGDINSTLVPEPGTLLLLGSGLLGAGAFARLRRRQ